MFTKALIIPAAGAGKRMQRELPKPFITLGDQPVLAHTVRRFLKLDGLQQIIVATSDDYLAKTRSILSEVVDSQISWQCVEGGEERQQSVYNALQEVAEVDQVLVHDAVRPFVELALIKQCCRQAEETGAAIPGFPCKETLKKIDDERWVVETPERKYMWQVQTPQVFDTDLLKEAYGWAASQNYVGTDDASLVEWLGKPVKIVEGSPKNIKITYPQDLELARILLKGKADHD